MKKLGRIALVVFLAFVGLGCKNPILETPKTVIFDSQGGSSVLSQKIDIGHLLSSPNAPAKLGYSFAGWYKEPTCINIWVFGVDKVTGDLTLYAKWDQAFSVIFDSQSGSAVASISSSANTLISAPTAPTRLGYIFSAWYMESACTNAWNFASDKVVGDLTLYAKWDQVFSVIFDSQSGSAVSAISASANTIIAAPSAPTRLGYNFSAWYKESACTNAWNFASDKVVGDLTLYAKWIKTLDVVSYSLKQSILDQAGIIYGEVKNSGPSGVTYAKVTASLRNSSGIEVATDYTYVDPSTIPAGSIYPFVMYTDVLYSQIISIVFSISYNSLTSYNPEKELSISNVVITKDYSGDEHFTGSIMNTGITAKSFCKIQIVFYDANGIVAYSDYTYASPSTIIGKTSNSFECYTNIKSSEYSTYRIIASSSDNY